jgi:hypothetical protein
MAAACAGAQTSASTTAGSIPAETAVVQGSASIIRLEKAVGSARACRRDTSTKLQARTAGVSSHAFSQVSFTIVVGLLCNYSRSPLLTVET